MQCNSSCKDQRPSEFEQHIRCRVFVLWL